MAPALNALFDKRALALTRARLRAWWDGEEFDAETAAAAIEANLGEAANDSGAGLENALFDEPVHEPPGRLQALMRLWGPHRLRPGDDAADALEIPRIGLAPDGVLAVSGAGLAGPLIAVAGAHPGKIEAFEWREESLPTLRAGVKSAQLDERISVIRVDLEAHVWPANTYDGVWSVDDFAYVGYAPHLAQQIVKMLKPGACAVIECYAGLPNDELATAFASSFAEPQIRAHGDLLQVFADVGLVVEQDEDLTEEFLDHARQGFMRLGQVLAEPASLDVSAARELAWEAEAWRVRLKLLAQRRLERRRFTLRKPGADAPAEEAPAAETPPAAD
jgi:SAM-dependent methyltransferase